ncbi:MAG: hypothetical protein Q3977_04685 [Oscillospiraceae bacterium]|nr:hypothetical protein [Oscillospiraceae bacterium]
MNDFLKFAYELIAQVIYNLTDWIVAIVDGFIRLFITGWGEYSTIVGAYLPHFNVLGKILSVLLIIILIGIPAGLIYLLVRRIILNIRLKTTKNDSSVLYREIGRLNQQVLDLMDEKNKILALKVKAVSGAGGEIPYNGSNALLDEQGAPTGKTAVLEGAVAESMPVPGAERAAFGMAVGGAGVAAGPIDPLAAPVPGAAVMGGAAIGEDTISAAASAAAAAAAEVRSNTERQNQGDTARFPKLSQVDAKYLEYEPPVYDDSITLEQLTEHFRLFAASQMNLYYTPEIIRRFISGMASSRLLILEGISGTGKTSLPYSFSRFLCNPATMVSVQPSYRDRTELLGYFNEFSKRFNETEFLRALYEANYRQDPNFIILDEMNLARIEYYFAEMLSVLEMPSHDEWIIDLVPTAWPGDPIRLDGGKIHVPDNLWFVGTANNDDSTFTITDKVYDRAIPIEINQRADAFECPPQSNCCVTSAHLTELFEQAKESNPISDATLAKMLRVDEYLQTRFKLAFGNRITKQMHDFIPVYVACGGTELDGMDYILARKVLKKFESLNVSFVRDEIKGLIAYFEKVFGKSHMQDSKGYLQRIQNLY